MSIQLTCNQLLDHLSDYIDGNLPDDLVAAAQEHLLTCTNCHRVLSSTQQTILLYREQQRTQTMPSARQQAIYEHLIGEFASKSGE